MTVKALLQWQNIDATLDLNNKTGTIIRRAIFQGPLSVPTGGAVAEAGGRVTPSTTTMTITISPFTAQTADGMVLLNDTNIDLTMPIPSVFPATYWVVVYARYRLYEDPLVESLIVPESQLSAMDGEYYIRFAKFTLTAPVANAAAADWDFSVGDHSESLGQSPWRAPVDTLADLPLPTDTPPYKGLIPNKDGDVRVTKDTLVPYVWDEVGQSWNKFGVTNVGDVQTRGFALQRQFQRAGQGTGIDSLGAHNDSLPDGKDVGLNRRGLDSIIIKDEASPASTYWVKIAPFQAYINGLPVSTKEVEVTLGSPGPGVQYDLVYLEVYRRRITTASSAVEYENNTPNATPPPDFEAYTFDEVATLIDQIDGYIDTFGYSATTGNLNFTNMERLNDGSTVITDWKFSVRANAPLSLSGQIEGMTALNGADVTLPGFPGSATYGLLANNDRIGYYYSSTADATIVEGVAYAIPLVVFLSNDYLDGVLEGIEEPLGIIPDVTGAQIDIPRGVWNLRGHPFQLEPQSVQPSAAPATGFRRDLVFLVYFMVPYYMEGGVPGLTTWAAATSSAKPYMLSWDNDKGRQLYRMQAFYAVSDVGSALDSEDAMTALGFSYNEQEGHWRRNISADPNFDEFKAMSGFNLYALPVGIVHRRNSSAWNVTSNYNGSTVGGAVRPEEEFGGISMSGVDIIPRELVDLRQLTGDVDLEQKMQLTVDKMMHGDLDTSLLTSPMDEESAGTSHLVMDTLGFDHAGTHHANTIASEDRTLDGVRYCWSDAVDTQVVGWTTTTAFNASVDAQSIDSGPNGTQPAPLHVPEEDLMLSRHLMADDKAGGLTRRPIYEVWFIDASSSPGGIWLKIRAPYGAYIHSDALVNRDFFLGVPVVSPDYRHNFGLQSLTFIPADAVVDGNIPNPAPGTFPRTSILRAAVTRDVRGSYNVYHDDNVTTPYSQVQYIDQLVYDAVDNQGRPTEMTVYFRKAVMPWMPSDMQQKHIHVACAFVFDKPHTANKSENDFTYGNDPVDDHVGGLTLVPKEVYNINGVVAGQPYSDIPVGPLSFQFDSTVTTPATHTITAADVQTALLAAGIPATNVRLYGILDVPKDAAGNRVAVNRVGTPVVGVPTSAPFDELELDVAVVPGTVVTFKVAYTSTEQRFWVEAYPTNKGIYGPFTWAVEQIEMTPNELGNATYNTPERLYTFSVTHPLKDPDQFMIGMGSAIEPGAVAGTAHGKRNSPYGYYHFYNAAGQFRYYNLAPGVAYAPAYPQPYAYNMGRFIRGLNTIESAVNGWSCMYHDSYGPYVFTPVAAPTTLVNCHSVMVYPMAVPLTQGDELNIIYEGKTYQGMMGDNASMSDKWDRIVNEVIPDQNESLKYESVGDVHVTTAGPGIAPLDFRDVGVLQQFFSGGQGPMFRPTFYDPMLALKHGLNPSYRDRLLNSARLNPKTGTDRADSFDAGDEADQVMYFVPGPPSQYGTNPAAIGATTPYHGGMGPGNISDYDQGALTSSMLPEGGFIGGPLVNMQNYDTGPETTSKVTPTDISTGIQGKVTETIVSEPNEISANRSFAPTRLLSRNAGSTKCPVDGYELVRTASSTTMTTLKNRFIGWSAYQPEHVGRPNAPLKGRGTQGMHTARSTAGLLGSVPAAAMPCETFLLPCRVDQEYYPGPAIPKTEQSDTLLSQSSHAYAVQNQGNTFFPGQCLFYFQETDPGYPASVTTTLAVQKMWAFKPSVVNRDGRCMLLVNSGYGSSLVKDWHLPGVEAGNVHPHTGYSADIFRLVHRPVRKR